VKHYFACIDIAERVKFFSLDHEIWKYEYEVELKNVPLVPNFTAVDPIAREEARVKEEARRKAEARRRVSATLTTVAVAIEAQYRRTQILRKALRAPREGTIATEGAQPNRKAPSGTEDLVGDVENSCRKWRSSGQYREGIEQVKKWKHGRALRAVIEDSGSTSNSDATGSNEPPRLQPPSDNEDSIDPGRVRAQQIIAEHTKRQPTAEQDGADYVLERDINAYLIQYTRQKEEGQRTPPGITPTSTMSTTSTTSTPETVEHTSEITTSDKTSSSESLHRNRLTPVDEGLDDCRFKGRFPGQRLSIESLLGDPVKGLDLGLNVLSKDRSQTVDSTRIRYFHIPSNNMEVRALDSPRNLVSADLKILLSG
jgi:hypothetical protein